MQTEPLLSIPIGTFLLIVLLVLVAVALVAAIGLSRRARGASSDADIVSEVMEGAGSVIEGAIIEGKSG